MAGKLKRWITEETFDDVRLWIHKLVHNFRKQYGGDFYELLAEANFIFACSLDKFDPNRARLTTFLHRKITGGLIDYKKKQWARGEVSIEDMPEHQFISKRAHTFLIEFLDELDIDARLVVQQILQPDPVLVMILQSKQGLRYARRGLRQYFMTKQGWSSEQVDDAFWQITTALWKFIR